MLATARTFTLVGVGAQEVQVEVDVRRGLPSFSLVGLPDAAVRESRERVQAAVCNSGFEFPQRRITANLAPADLRKQGPGIDLAIAAGILAASGQLPSSVLRGCGLAGELALDGSVRPVAGVLAMAEQSQRSGLERIIVPVPNQAEAKLLDQIEVLGLDHLSRLGELAAGSFDCSGGPEHPKTGVGDATAGGPDFADLRGQAQLRRALEVAVAGRHAVLITGPPGAGKSMAARRVPSILPGMDDHERIEVTRIASAAGRLRPGTAVASRPFRAPHHTISAAGLIGGGNPPRPGEITLAHGGVLFLDEVAEFSRSALEGLRQPLEEGEVTISRVHRSIVMPCDFMLVAASNPCPCGRGADDGDCACPTHLIRRYQSKLSGPLADRIDIVISVVQPSPAAMLGDSGEDSRAIRARVEAAGEFRSGRIQEGIDPGPLSRSVGALITSAHDRAGLSGRGHSRILRVARTIADLGGHELIEEDDLAEAIGMRRRGVS